MSQATRVLQSGSRSYCLPPTVGCRRHRRVRERDFRRKTSVSPPQNVSPPRDCACQVVSVHRDKKKNVYKWDYSQEASASHTPRKHGTTPEESTCMSVGVFQIPCICCLWEWGILTNFAPTINESALTSSCRRFVPTYWACHGAWGWSPCARCWVSTHHIPPWRTVVRPPMRRGVWYPPSHWFRALELVINSIRFAQGIHGVIVEWW
jgi:hypothetical protein